MKPKPPKLSPWQQSHFADTDNDPLTGFANIMDVMLVFALGLLIALLTQHQALREHFDLQPVEIQQGRELIETPQAISEALNSGEGMESLGEVYRDPETGKLILIGR